MRDGGPAFPGGDGPYSGSPGMSRRDYFAAQALSALIARHRADVPWEAVAPTSFKIADAMIGASNANVVNPEVDRLAVENAGLREQVEYLESLRPHWAKGYSSDSIAAQTSTSALVELWKMLGVKNQTMAVQRLRELVSQETP